MQAKLAAVPSKAGTAKHKIVSEAYRFSRHGWPSVRKAVLTFVAAALLGGAMVAGGRLLLAQARPAMAAAQARQIVARDQLAQGRMERDDIRLFQPRFEQLRQRGFIGPENRLAMVEAIQAIQQARGLMPITFSLLPQQAVVLDPLLLEAPLELHASGMLLNVDLLHEMDLLLFFNDLKARGFFTVRECRITSLGASANVGGARLNAECALHWLSVDTAATAPVEGAG